MAITYEPIGTYTATGSENGIDFNIPASYTDLKVVINATTANSTHIRLRFNNDTGTNYSNTSLIGDGFSAVSYVRNSTAGIELTEFNTIGTSSTVWGLWTADIFAYRNSAYKSCIVKSTQGTETMQKSATWRNTSAITTVSLTLLGSTYNAGTVATVYGILRA